MELKELLKTLSAKYQAKHGKPLVAFTVHTPDETIGIGEGAPVFEVYLRNQAGVNAFKSLNKLQISEAYIGGDIDFEGSLIEAVSSQATLFSDRNLLIKIWRHLKPLLLGRKKCNPAWVAKHYDSDNLQLLVVDQDYNTYTQGIHENDDESLEVAAERKLAFAFQSLQLKPQDSLLEIGCGWGGFLRYAARRQVEVTGITLSRDQKQFVDKLIKDNHFNAQVHYQDFFAWQPPKKYDAISLMGIIEELSDYQQVMKNIAQWIKPGGRVYMDFAADKQSFTTASFITKYVWPGKFRLVYMPQFIDAVGNSPFEVVAIHNDRHNYYLWSKGIMERWEQKKAEVVKQSNEELWRTFHLLFAATASLMENSTYLKTAYRVILEFPSDFMPS